MSTTPTTISLAGSDMLYLSTCLLRGIHVLNELAFKDNAQNYWLARITPPDMSQRQDAYQSRTRPFQRRYLQVPAGGSRIQFDTHDLAYGFAYEFGGDRVTTDRRIPARIYCVYLGTNGTGTVAEFRIFPTAEAAMECERQRALATPVYDPAPAIDAAPKPILTSIATVPAVEAYMKLMYAEMVKSLTCIHCLEKRLKEAGYKFEIPEPESTLFTDARAAGESDGALLWKQGLREAIALVEADAIASKALAAVDAEKAARKAQEAPVTPAAPVAQPVTADPAKAQADLLDAIVDKQSPAPAPAKPFVAFLERQPTRRLTKSQVIAAARAAKPPAGPRSTSEPHTVSRPRPSNVPASTDPDCPF